jgi:hypothetical protein
MKGYRPAVSRALNLIQVKDGRATVAQMTEDGAFCAKGRCSMATSPRLCPTFVRVIHRRALMDEMMETSGVDPIAAVRTGEGFVAARATCRECTHDDGCRTWFLEGRDALGQPAEFCPNAEFFRACKREGG